MAATAPGLQTRDESMLLRITKPPGGRSERSSECCCKIHPMNAASRTLLERKLVLDEDASWCPVRATLALVGQKWVPRIIYELMRGKRRFNELSCAVGGCNSRTLRDRLKGLEELGLIQREVVTVMPPWVEYELTEKGQKLGEALKRIEEWGRTYMSEPLP